jgi:hypothetical protein
LLCPYIAIAKSRLHASELDVVVHLAPGAPRWQGLGDLEKQWQSRLRSPRGSGQLLGPVQIAAVFGAQLALTDGEKRRSTRGTDRCGIGRGRDGPERVVFAIRTGQTVEASAAASRSDGDGPAATAGRLSGGVQAPRVRDATSTAATLTARTHLLIVKRLHRVARTMMNDPRVIAWFFLL